MKRCARRCFVLFAFALCLCALGAVSQAGSPHSCSNNIVLAQGDLQPIGHGGPLPGNMEIRGVDGSPVPFAEMPVKAQNALSLFVKRVVSRIEFVDADPLEVIRFITAKPRPAHTIQLGVIQPDEQADPAPAWMEALDVGDRKVTCSLTNASLLSLSIKLAESLNLEFGVTPEGETVFRGKQEVNRAGPSAYAVHLKADNSDSL